MTQKLIKCRSQIYRLLAWTHRNQIVLFQIVLMVLY